MIVLYLSAKGAEHFDAATLSIDKLAAGKLASSHAVKHLPAAPGAYCVLLLLKQWRMP